MIRIARLIIFIGLALFHPIIFGLTFNKDSPVYYYVNHEIQLKEIRQYLNSHSIVGITGATAMGKSEMAKKYIELYEEEYDIIALFDSSSNLTSQFIDLIREINKTICIKEGCNLSDNPRTAKQTLLNYLKGRKHWLLVFDNIYVKENHKVKDIIDLKHQGNVIICSQDEEYLNYTVKAPYLETKDSHLVIKKIMSNPSRQYIEELTKLFQGQPYMIANSAIYLQNYPHMTIEDYIKYMKGNDNKVKKHLELCMRNISEGSKNLLYIISLMDNQNITRELLTHLVNNKDELSTYINEVISYGLVEQVDKGTSYHVFRMHDVIKDELQHFISNQSFIINSILDNLSKYMPINQSISERFLLITKPHTQSNIEKLLRNAEINNGDIYKTMRGNDILLDHYLKIRDWENCRFKLEWLLEKEQASMINLNKMDINAKVTYGHYLTNIGVYKDFAESDFISSIKFYEQAKKILDKTNCSYLVSNTAIFQLALTQVSIGDLISAKKNTDTILEVLEKNNVPIEQDRVLYCLAKIYLAQGKYEKALEEINKIVKAEEHLYKETISTPIYLLKAEILNYMNNSKAAYDICNPLYLNEIQRFNYPHELLARILTQLSRAELGLGMKEESLNHAIEASEFFKEEYLNTRYKHPVNDKFAAALVAKGDALIKHGKFQEAITEYSFARNIYFNRYRHNFSNMDDVSYTLAQAAKAACKLNDSKLYRIFRNDLFQKFGKAHFRSKEVISICEIKSNL